MLAKIKILKVINKDEVSKNGKPYIKCSIKTLDKNGQEVWLNSFGNNTTKSWADGETVDLEIFQEEYNGKMSLKFKTPPETNIVELLKEMNAKLDWLVGDKKAEYPTNPAGQSVPEKQTDELPDFLS